jgi:hypothetical protein
MRLTSRPVARPSLPGKSARSRRTGAGKRRPKVFQGEGAYGIKSIVASVVPRRVRSLLAPDGPARTEPGSGLGKTRYVVERKLWRVGNSRRLKG